MRLGGVMTDPALPGLAASLDPEGFLARLRGRLPECREELAIEDGTIFDVQYKPGASGVVLYRLKLRERASGRSRRQYLSVRALGAGQRPRPPAPAALRGYAALKGGGLRTPYLEMPEERLVAYAFPLDPVLASLLPATDPARMRDALQTLWRERGVRVRRVTAEPLGYTPHARAALRYEVLSEARGTGVPELRHLVGKIHAEKRAARLFAGAWALWRESRLRVGLAPPVGFVGPLDLALQERVSGERLGDLAAAPGAFVKPVRQAARALAVLHGLAVPTPSRRPASKEAEGVRRWGGVLAALRPERAARAQRLRDRLAAGLAARARVSATVHGDFHPANVLSDGERVTFIDVDQMAWGDPLVDVGRFLAALRVTALRLHGDAAALRPAGEAFLEQYLAQRGESERRARLFEAACLLTAAATGFRLQRPGWEESARALLEEAERVSERAGEGSAVGARAPARAGAPGEGSANGTSASPGAPERAAGAEAESASAVDADACRNAEPRPAVEPGAWAEDAIYMRAALAPGVAERCGAELLGVGIRRRGGRGGRVGRGRTLPRYRLTGRRLEGPRAGERWSLAARAVACRGAAARRAAEALDAANAALADRAEAPALPRPLAVLPELRLLVVEEGPGRRASELVRLAAGRGEGGPSATVARLLDAAAAGLDARERPSAPQPAEPARAAAQGEPAASSGARAAAGRASGASAREDSTRSKEEAP